MQNMEVLHSEVDKLIITGPGRRSFLSSAERDIFAVTLDMEDQQGQGYTKHEVKVICNVLNCILEYKYAKTSIWVECKYLGSCNKDGDC